MTRHVCFICFFLCGVLSSTATARDRDLVVVINSREIEPYKVALESLTQTLRGEGLDPILSERLLPDDPAARNALLADVRKSSPRLIVTLGSAATAFVSAFVKDIPVVFCMVLNPAASGFVRSMKASGNNVTGASLDIAPQAQFEALRSIVPSVRRIGVIYNPEETASIVEHARQAAKDMGLVLVAVPIDSPKEVPKELRKLGNSIDAFWSVADSTIFSSGSMEFILLHMLRNRIPFVGLSSAFVKAGALMALDVDYKEVGAQCAVLAARVLAGDSPSSLPITTPKRIIPYVNLKTAETIGLKIPSERLEALKLKGAVLLP